MQKTCYFTFILVKLKLTKQYKLIPIDKVSDNLQIIIIIIIKVYLVTFCFCFEN